MTTKQTRLLGHSALAGALTDPAANEHTDTSTVVPQQDQVSTRPDRDTAVEAIVGQAHCHRSDAERMLNWLQELIDEIRRSGYYTLHPETAQMAGVEYRIFDQIFEHSAGAPDPDTAADLVERFLLDPTRDETGIRHFQDGTGRHTYCCVEIMIHTVG